MRTRAELLFYIGMNYSKLPISISDQISLLKDRGLVIGDDAYAKEQLGIISYFRLADYLQPLEDNHSLHTFKSDATFEDAVTLYYFDKELRSLIFTAIGECYTPRKHVPHKIERNPCQISFSGYCGNGVPL